MNAVVLGKLSPLCTLEQVTDWPSIKKVCIFLFAIYMGSDFARQDHKLNVEPAIKEAAGDPVREHAIVDNIVISSVAMKSVMA